MTGMVVVAFVGGLGLGILLNVLADELPPDVIGEVHTPGWPRCRYCGAAHGPRDWLALAAYVLRRGRCEHCGAPRRLRAAILELTTGVCLAGLWVWAGGRWGAFLAAAVLAFIFILITIIDLEHRLILWRVVWPAAVAITLTQALNHGLQTTLIGGLAGYGIVFGMYLLGQLFSVALAWRRGQPLDEVAFGGGDVNLAALAGLAVGWPQILIVVTLAVFSGGLFSIGYLLVQLVRGRYNPYTAIPYGPFFVLGVTALYLFGPQLAAWYCGLAACRGVR